MSSSWSSAWMICQRNNKRSVFFFPVRILWICWGHNAIFCFSVSILLSQSLSSTSPTASVASKKKVNYCKLLAVSSFAWCIFLLYSILNDETDTILLIADLSRRAENMSRKNAGEEPLPEEDPSNPIFKPIPEPSRLDSFLITNQIANYCNQINGYVVHILKQLVFWFYLWSKIFFRIREQLLSSPFLCCVYLLSTCSGYFVFCDTFWIYASSF